MCVVCTQINFPMTRRRPGLRALAERHSTSTSLASCLNLLLELSSSSAPAPRSSSSSSCSMSLSVSSSPPFHGRTFPNLQFNFRTRPWLCTRETIASRWADTWHRFCTGLKLPRPPQAIGRNLFMRNALRKCEIFPFHKQSSGSVISSYKNTNTHRRPLVSSGATISLPHRRRENIPLLEGRRAPPHHPRMSEGANNPRPSCRTVTETRHSSARVH